MDLLKSLIVPAVRPSTPTDVFIGGHQHSYFTTAPHGQISVQRSPPAALARQAAHETAQQESASAPAKRKKKKKRKQRQTSPEQDKVAPPTVLTTPAAVTKAKKRSKNHLFHPDRPKSGANKRPLLSYEDLCDDDLDQQPNLPASDSKISKSNPEATQTCFFWYHGSCRRSLDKRDCQLRHALLDPPSKVVAPPRFVHPKPCELQWCAGDGPTRKGQKTKGGVEQKRYFEVAVSGGSSSRESSDENAEEEDECFLKGFEEPDA